MASRKDKRETTLIVLGITALVTALAEIGYGVIANYVTVKKPNQSSRGHLRPGRPCHYTHVPCLYGHGPPPGPRFSLAKQGGVCATANTSCCTYINTSGIVEEHEDYILQQAKCLQEQSLETQVSIQVWEQIKSWLPSRTWFLPFLGPIVVIILLLVFGPCILNLLVKFVSSPLESIKLQMPLMEMKMTYYRGPLNNPSSGQP
jgi:hypothetical protein